MAGSRKKNKKEKVGAENEKGSPKTRGKKENDDPTVKIDALKSIILEDNLWQSVVVIIIIENQKLYGSLLQQLNSLPANFTVITPTNLLNTSEKEPPKSRGSSKSKKRSDSKSSKKTNKTKHTGDKKDGQKEEQSDRQSGGDSNCIETCTLLKKYILELRNADIKEYENREKSEQDEKLNNIVMNDKEVYEKLEHCGLKSSRSEERSFIQRYILLWGFYNLDLLQECSNFNILVKAMISIKEKCTRKISIEIPSVMEKTKKGKAKSSLEFNRPSEEYSVFVEKFCENMKDVTFLEKNKDVLFLNYKSSSSPEKFKKINDDGKEAQSDFELNILKIMCGIAEAWRKFNKYNECLKLQEIPEVQEVLTLDDAKLYTTLVSMIPTECITVPIIIHSMLEQICWWDEHILSKISVTGESIDLSINNTSTVQVPVLQHSISSISTLTTGTDTISQTVQPTVTVKNITPTLIDERDEIRKNTFHLHLPEINFQKITTDMLLNSPIYRLWLNYPLGSLSESKWFQFHLQRFKTCAENCYYDSEKLFILHLLQSVMNILITKPDKLSIRKVDKFISETEESDTYLFSPNSETAERDSLSSFVRAIICNILCRVSKSYPNNSSFSITSTHSVESTSKEIDEDESSRFSIQSKWYDENYIKTPQTYQLGCLLNEKLNCRKDKLNKLKSFLLCSEFVNLYEDVNQYTRHEETDYMKRYEFIEKLSVTSMCQSLQNAYENFLNANYYYFSPSDTILLWFNNTSKRDIDISFSRQMKGVLETPLGFRDFYKYKLGGKINFEEMSVDEAAADSFSDIESGSLFSHQLSYMNHTSHSKTDEFMQTTVSNVGSLRIEHVESYEYFFSPDGTSVTLKKTKYFSDKMIIAVFIKKNNTKLYYDFLSETPSSEIKVRMVMHNDTMVQADLTWDPPVTMDELCPPDLSITDDKFSINCNLSITLPSGLFIEVVPTESIIGPYYIRQRYLVKGPNCGEIWEENHRCYLKNGTILIFNSDSTVYILYNNGTIVRCNSFEWEKIVLTNVPIKNETLTKDNINFNDTKTTKTKEDIHNEVKKEGKGKNKENKNNKGQKIISPSKKKKDQKISNLLIEDDNPKEEEGNSEQEIYIYNITEHSVLSWDGFCTEFNKEICKNNSKIQDLRMAFHDIRQELYLHRSDGMTTLFTPHKLSVLFPEGSKITSITEASKELNVESEELVEEDTPGDVIQTQEISNDTESHSKTSESDSLTPYSIEMSVSHSNESQNGKDTTLNKDNFVYPETSYLFEHNNYARIKYINGDCEVEITLPGNIVIHVDKNKMFTIDSNENERITLTESNLFFEAQVMEDTQQRPITTLHFKNVTKTVNVSCQTVDSLCNVFSINEKGQTRTIRNRTEDCTVSYTPLHPENIERFFVLNRDLTGYEMVQNYRNTDESTKESVKSPITKNSNEVFSVHTQTSIFKNKSEKYILSYIEEKNLPTSIKRKDLLKLEEMPEKIWFYSCLKNSPDGSKPGKNVQKIELPLAVSISKYFKIKNNINLSHWFSTAIHKYMGMNENMFNKYLNYYPDEIINEDIFDEGERHKQEVLGSQSYYLTDNLPTLFLNNLLKNDEDKLSIHSD